jgi:CheY-like chemotaxis protein
MPDCAPLAPILLVDDSADDRFFVCRLLLKNGVKNPILAFEDAPAAIAFLRSLRGKDKGPLPSMIVTDLKMPGMDGFELLAAIRSNKAFDACPLVVLSDSGAQRDVKRAGELGADYYLVKMPSVADLAGVLSACGRRGK